MEIGKQSKKSESFEEGFPIKRAIQLKKEKPHDIMNTCNDSVNSHLDLNSDYDDDYSSYHDESYSTYNSDRFDDISYMSSSLSTWSPSFPQSIHDSGQEQCSELPGEKPPTNYEENFSNNSEGKAQKIELSKKLAERVSIIDSIKWLGNHLPESVVAFLIDEIEVEEDRKEELVYYDDLQNNGMFDDESRQSSRTNSINRTSLDQYQYHGDYYSIYDGDSSSFPNNKKTVDIDDDENDSINSSCQVPLHQEENYPAGAVYHHQPKNNNGIQTNSNNQPTKKNSCGHRRSLRKSNSMPLVVRCMEGRSLSNRTLGQNFESDEGCDSEQSYGSDASSPLNDKNYKRESFAKESKYSNSSKMNALFGEDSIGPAGHFSGGSESTSRNYSDETKNESKTKQKILRESRFTKTRHSIGKLSDDLEMADLPYELDEENEWDDDPNLYFTDAIPPATRHVCALLFVDISGFTKLSTVLAIEPFSKVINNYFQMIVEEVEAFGGDILKFAGDAVFCEWQATTSNRLESIDGNSSAESSQHSMETVLEECVFTAAACGARIVNKCSDHPVYNKGESSGTKIGTLNVHCGVGFGEVVGVHVGDRETRMEYLILGDPIDQVADAVLVASRGEVVASPEALILLKEIAELDECVLPLDMNKTQVIACKSKCYFTPIGMEPPIMQDTTKPRERLAKRCDDWDLPALTRLRKRMALYIHEVVVNEEFAMKFYPGDLSRPQERHRSEAELRDVYTVFIMPLITARLTGDDTEDSKIILLLNDIMLIMTRELSRFKGHLRQFIVDDKGVVLIANFGLRGSTFPNMIAERAIPFTSTVQSLLKDELDTECQMGATFDKAYCGIVGGVSRHEYAILGPSVNLAARLMENSENTGFLVDSSVKEKAGSRQFKALTPVKAKGYKHLVPIFQPLQTTKKTIKGLSEEFVSRKYVIDTILSISVDIIEKGGPARLILLSAEPGTGMSALHSASNQIKNMSIAEKIQQLSICILCSETDIFVPFSITRPLFLKILEYINGDVPHDYKDDFVVEKNEIDALLHGQVSQMKVSQSLLHLVQICEMAEIPDQFIEILGKLILTRNRADIAYGETTSSCMLMMNSIAQYIVKLFLHCTISFDLVFLTLDDVSHMDDMSWKVVELLYKHSHNVIILGSRCEEDELKVDSAFWESVQSEGLDLGQFTELSLTSIQVSQLSSQNCDRNANGLGSHFPNNSATQSEEMSNLASELITKLYRNDNTTDGTQNHQHNLSETSQYNESLEEFVIHRMDLLPSSVRIHLNLGAILGHSFELMDVVTVFEQYRDLQEVQEEERLEHAKSVHDSLEEAVDEGILETTTKESVLYARYTTSEHPYSVHNITYRFTHNAWRNNIMRLTLNEWKRDMHSLIAQSLERTMDSQLANDYRMLTRLFSHWKESENAKKAATLALKMGRRLEEIGLTHQSLIVYRESLDMWKAMDSNADEQDESVGGLSVDLLEKLESSDIEHLINLNVALGRCYTNVIDPKESVNAFQTALNFIHKAPSSVYLKDRSIIFPVFSGLFVALRFGNNEDFQYENGLVKMFLRETKLFNNTVHHSRALAMQAEMLGRHGEFKMAINIANNLRVMYDVDKHSNLISQAYGSDRCGQCIAQMPLWYEQIHDFEEAIKMCYLVIEDLLPKMDPQNVQNSFYMLYPIVCIMKKYGHALEAKEFFEIYVIENFKSKLDIHGSTSERPLHMPIMYLLDMISTNCDTPNLQEYSKWMSAEQNGLFRPELNSIMGSIGRTADSITAEICLLLAKHTTDRSREAFFVKKGFEVARDTMELTREKEKTRGMIVAYTQIKPIYEELNEMYTRLSLMPSTINHCYL